MSYRSNQTGNYGGSNRPNPWLNGAPPALLPTPDIGRGGFGQLLPHQSSLLGMHPNFLNQQQQFGQPQVFGNHDLSLFMNNVSNIPQRRMDSRWELDNDSKRLRMSNQRSGRQDYHGDNRRKSWQSSSDRWREHRSRRDNNRGNQRRRSNDNRNRQGNKSTSNNKSEENKKESDDSENKSNSERQAYDPASPTSDEEVTSDRKDEKSDKSDSGSRKRRRSTSPKKTESSEDSSNNVLQVTIQRGQHGRNFTKDQKGGGSTAKSFFCTVCNVSCPNQENFTKHENSRSHKLFAMQREKAKKAAEAAEKGNEEPKESEEKTSRECKLCKISFTGTLIEHKQSREHKACEEANKEENEEEMLETKPDVTDTFNDESNVDEPQPSPPASSQDPISSNSQIPKYDPNVAVGQNHLVFLSGKFCKLCRKFYKDPDVAEQHCKSESHYQNFVKYKKPKSRGSAAPVSANQGEDIVDNESVPSQDVDSTVQVKEEKVEEGRVTEEHVKDDAVDEESEKVAEHVKSEPMDSEDTLTTSGASGLDKSSESVESAIGENGNDNAIKEEPCTSPQIDQIANSEGDENDEDDYDSSTSTPRKGTRKKASPANKGKRGKGRGRK